MAKHIFVTGGVVSSLGKGLTCASIGMILGLSAMIIVVGQIGGPIIAGIFADLTGNYRAGFTTLALLAGAGSLFFMMAKRPVLSREAAG